jgi:hypothetical protein
MGIDISTQYIVRGAVLVVGGAKALHHNLHDMRQDFLNKCRKLMQDLT